MRLRLTLIAACCAAALGGCYQQSPALQTIPTESIPVSDLRPSSAPSAVAATPAPPVATPSATPIELSSTPTPSPTTPASQSPVPSVLPSPQGTAPVALATPSAQCVNGWISPAAGSAEYSAALDMVEGQMGIAGPWTVSEMRYFTGPDVPWILEPHYDVVDYWYVRAALTDDPSFRARWLLEQRTDTIRGISAVAPFDSLGYQSPDWTGFTGDGRPQTYLGLPGEWSGVPYDFVTGEGDSGQPGLPDQVVGCLSAT